MLTGTVLVYLTQTLISPALASIMADMSVDAVTGRADNRRRSDVFNFVGGQNVARRGSRSSVANDNISGTCNISTRKTRRGNGYGWIKNVEAFERTAFDAKSVILSTLGLLCLLYAISSFTSADDYSLLALLLIVGLICIGIFVRRQNQIAEPVLRVDTLKSHRFTLAVITVMFVQAALVSSTVIIPIFIQNVCERSATVSGLAVMPGAIIGAFVATLAGRLFDKYGARRVALLGAAFMLAGGFLFTFFNPNSSMIYCSVSLAVPTIGLHLILTPINTWGVNSLDNSLVQHATAVQNTMNQVAGSLGTALVVSISALALYVFPQAPKQELSYLGDHLALITIFALSVIIFMLVFLFLRGDEPQLQKISS